MLKVKQFVFNPFGVNTFVISDSDTSEAMVIDPGMTSAHEQKLFDDYIAANNLRITQIVNTHLHLDHCFGDNYVRNKYGVKVAAHADDAPYCTYPDTRPAELHSTAPKASSPLSATPYSVAQSAGQTFRAATMPRLSLH